MSRADFTSKTVKQRMTRGTGKLNLKTAETERVTITAEQQKQIKDLYEQMSKEVGKMAKKAPQIPSGPLRQQYLFELQKQLNAEFERAGAELKGTIQDNMWRASHAVVEDNLKFLEQVGMPVGGAFSHVPDDVVRAVVTGQLYEGNWTLSKAIWRTTKTSQQDINTIIAKGIAENKSAYDIAKDLEKYVKPSAQKDWEWSKVYPGTARVVDYNAQRLARTMVSHAYQQSFVRTTQQNPFVTEYRWLSSGGERMCEICEERDGKLFAKDDLPMDHPNGMCTFEAVIPKSMTEIADTLADWANGGINPELDKYALSLTGVDSSRVTKQNSPKSSKLPEYSPITMTPEDWEMWAIDPEPFQDSLLEGDVPLYLSGEKLTKEQSDRIVQASRQIQVEALTHKYKDITTVYRGESYDSLSEIMARYEPGKTFVTDKLTSVATERYIAQEYSTMSDREYSLIQIISEPKGIRGIMTDPMGTGGSAEIISPIGNKYKVTSVDVNEETKEVKVYLFGIEENKKLSKADAQKSLKDL